MATRAPAFEWLAVRAHHKFFANAWATVPPISQVGQRLMVAASPRNALRRQRFNMEGLRRLLATEQWGAAPGAPGGGSVERALRVGPLAAAVAEWGDRDLGVWLEGGNPFAGGRGYWGDV